MLIFAFQWRFPQKMSISHVRDHYYDSLSADDVNFLASEGRDYFLSNGMIFKNQNGNLQHRPFTLLPTPFPRKLFEAAREVQTDFNLLVHNISQDYEFTRRALLRYIIDFMHGSKYREDTRWREDMNFMYNISLVRHAHQWDIVFASREDTIHIFEPTCNVLLLYRQTLQNRNFEPGTNLT